MGLAKQQQILEMERGWKSAGDLYVCDDCFSDYALKAFVSRNASSTDCSFCDRTSSRAPIAVPIDDVLELINQSLCTEWGDPDDEGIPYDSREGGYQWSTTDTYDLFLDEVNPATANGELYDTIFLAFEERLWCQKEAFRLRPDVRLYNSWKHFSSLTKHKNRYLFLMDHDPDGEFRDPDYIAPATMLSRIGEVVADLGLIRTLPAGTQIYRARLHHPDISLSRVSELSPPPPEQAVHANRMSPAGIPMFYGSFDSKVAVQEVCYGEEMNNGVVTVGIFVTARPIEVVDFVNLPDFPSLFDEERRHQRFPISFLYGFVTDLCCPIDRDGRDHIEYVPTQIVTEYFRHVFPSRYGVEVSGLIYESARNRRGENCALFFGSDHCREYSAGWDRDASAWLALETVNRCSI